VTEGNKDEALNRELNLTWSRERPDHNPLVAGSWPPKAGGCRLKRDWRSGLGVKLGDSVTFTGDTQDFSAKVSSVRGRLGACGRTSSLSSRRGRSTASRKAG
jgi:putative ABC transport system permease protein